MTSSSGNDEKDDDFARVVAASVRGRRLLAPSPAYLSLSGEDFFFVRCVDFIQKLTKAEGNVFGKSKMWTTRESSQRVNQIIAVNMNARILKGDHYKKRYMYMF